eukprot:TRINITY_DN2840_c0_g1_i5.p1 TRINITY_DN2840_c0_g1~~TRINITY_DN2840_c0_g1_i5.p1  ORF type:complete len:361 (-),score=80.54 TRINITY_DN2840_c0_g1_i5:1440-2522(-)
MSERSFTPSASQPPKVGIAIKKSDTPSSVGSGSVFSTSSVPSPAKSSVTPSVEFILQKLLVSQEDSKKESAEFQSFVVNEIKSLKAGMNERIGKLEADNFHSENAPIYSSTPFKPNSGTWTKEDPKVSFGSSQQKKLDLSMMATVNELPPVLITARPSYADVQSSSEERKNYRDTVKKNLKPFSSDVNPESWILRMDKYLHLGVGSVWLHQIEALRGYFEEPMQSAVFGNHDKGIDPYLSLDDFWTRFWATYGSNSISVSEARDKLVSLRMEYGTPALAHITSFNELWNVALIPDSDGLKKWFFIRTLTDKLRKEIVVLDSQCSFEQVVSKVSDLDQNDRRNKKVLKEKDFNIFLHAQNQ